MNTWECRERMRSGMKMNTRGTEYRPEIHIHPNNPFIFFAMKFVAKVGASR